MYYKEYKRQVDLYHIHRTSSEHGRLTEDLLPQYVLHNVLQQAVQKGFDYVSQIEWYYQYLTVEPVWQSGQNLVYRISIPLFYKHTYLMFNVYTYPNPVPNSSYSIQVKLEKHYGLDTITGGLFVTTSCAGRSSLARLEWSGTVI